MDVRRLHYAEKTEEKILSATGNHVMEGVRLLRDIQLHSLELDGRMPQSDLDNQSRYMIGPPQGTNTCAIDAMIFAAIRLDAGRTQIDQLSIRAFSQQKEVPKMIRRIMGQLWGELDTQLRADQRNLVAKALAEYPGFDMPLGATLAISEVAIACFEGFAQLSYTATDVRICCDNVPRYTSTARVERLHYYPVSNMSGGVQRALANGFAAHPITDLESRAGACSRGRNCQHTPHVTRMVLDRLPPHFMIIMPKPIDVSRSRLFSNIRFEYHKRKGWATVEYRVIGCIIHVIDTSHFIVRWRAEHAGETSSTIVHFDGLSSEQADYVCSWDKREGRQKLGVEVLFYRICSE
jgi:hypothetical protein